MFKNDCDGLLAVKQDRGFDLTSENCKKFNFKTIKKKQCWTFD